MRLGMSRTTKIIILLCIDACFFLLELITGYAVGSLALVADSFHMLNDVVSLVIALYAIKLSTASANSKYSYGWHRAEILAALINGVFLLALCFSIFMEALEKFIKTPEVSNPHVVVVVGSLGLLSNLVGLVLFHDHTHHDGDYVSQTTEISESGYQHVRTEQTPLLRHNSDPAQRSSGSSLYGHPIQNRQYLLEAAQDIQQQSEREMGQLDGDAGNSEETEMHGHVLQKGKVLIDVDEGGRDGRSPSSKLRRKRHSAGSMNIRALVLHVLGDALGNIGVIATGLIIWLSDWSFKFYFDPIISLVITVIIFLSAMPLVKSASFILLQGVPPTVSLERVRQAIREVPGVLSIHELHVWQLSESKFIASVHVCISSKANYMDVQTKIRNVLHNQGMHSSTIQPEVYHSQPEIPEEDLVTSVDTRCLLACSPGQECCNSENACCPPGQTPGQFLSCPPTPP